MSQFDVFVNPLSRARRIYPYVAILQSDSADTGSRRIVAPLAPKSRLPGVAGRLTPHVHALDTDLVLVVPHLASVSSTELVESRGHLRGYRDAIVAAIDYLFLGV